MVNKKFLIVDIIPLIRLPAKAPDTFYYFTDKQIAIGQLVKIKFKKKEVLGYVYAFEDLPQKRSFLKEKKLSLQPILEIINPNPPLTQEQLKLARWLKNYTSLSLSTALSMFIPYKSLLKISFSPSTNNAYKKFAIDYQSKINLDELKNKKVLIIVPQESYLNYLVQLIQPDFIIFNKISAKEINLLIKAVAENEKKIFLGVKNAIFLPWQKLDMLVIYDEGSYFYKEFFKPPYFDYRKIFIKFAEFHKIKYLAIDSFPSFHLIKNLNLKIKSKINFTRITEHQFLEKLKESKKNLIFTPEKMLSQKVMCERCFKPLICSVCQQNLVYSANSLNCRFCLKNYSLPEACPHCQQKTSFMVKGKSGEIVFKNLSKIFPNVFFLNKENPTTIRDFLRLDEAILIGSLYLLHHQLKGQALFFFNFEKFYLNYSLYQRELFLRVLNFFNDKVEKIYLVSQIVNPTIEEKIKNGTIINFLLEERKINDLPPYKRLIVIKEGGQNLNKLQQQLIQIRKSLEEKEPRLNIIGPIFSHPFKIKKRFFLELVIKIEDNLSFNLKKILEGINLEKIDIDSINF